MMDQYILTGNPDPQSAYAMGVIAEKYSLLKDYEDYADVFLKKKIAKSSKLIDTKHLINLILRKNLSYGPIYNLSTRELKVLREYLNSALNKR